MTARLCRSIVELGPRGCLMLLAAPMWVVIGTGVALDVAGRPDGAPHLLIPPEARAIMWIVPGLIGLAAAWWPRGRPTAVGLMWVMPCLRVGSYAVAWATSLPLVGDVLPGDGAPAGWYGAALHGALLLLVICMRAAPPSWPAHCTRRDR